MKMRDMKLGVCGVALSWMMAVSGALAETVRTIYIDAANNNGPAATWNNLAFHVADSAAFLKDSSGRYTGIRATVTAPLGPGVNSNGANPPTGDAAEFAPAGASNTYGRDSVPYGEAVLTGLDPAKTYSFTFYGSRTGLSGQNRETRYTATGATAGTALLDIVNNTSGVASVPDIAPTAGGTISLRVQAGPNNTNTDGPHFFHISAFKFTYADAPGKRLLFFGNSFSMGSDVPGHVAALAALRGHPVPVAVADLMGGKDLAYHINEVDTNAAANVASAALTGADTWDFVVMQGYSTEATHLRDASVFRANALALYERVRGHASGKGAGVVPVLYQTWARAPGHSFYPGSFSGPAAMQHEIRTNYQAAAALIAAAAPDVTPRIAPVGDAFELGGFSPARLYAADLYHAGNLGPSIAALCLYAAIYGESPTDIPWADVSESGWTSMSSNDWTRAVHWSAGLPAPALGETARAVYIDAVGNNGPAASWNNLPFSTAIGSASGTLILKDSEGRSTGIRATLTSRMDGTNSNATNNPTGDAAEFKPAGGNNCHGHPLINSGFVSMTPLGELTLSNLNPNVAYDFTFYASRMGSGSDRRTARYTVAGATSGYDDLDAANNYQNVARVNGIYPLSDGTATVRVEAAPDNNEAIKFYYIAAMKIAWTDPPPTQIYIDAYANDASHALPAGWNLLDLSNANATALKDAEDADTGIQGIVTASTSGSSSWGNYTHTGDAAEFAPAWVNGAYTQNDVPGTFTFYNLKPDTPYTFTFFANRPGVSDNRTARYIVSGANVDTNELDASANAANVAVVADIRPTADRTITVSFRKGTGNTANYNYLTACKIAYTDNGVAAPELPPPSGKHILILGNHLFNADNIPNMLANIAVAAGRERPFVVADTPNSATLAIHLTRAADGNLALRGIDHPRLTQGAVWDHAVLQSSILEPTTQGDPAAFRTNVLALYRAVKNHASGKGAGVSPVLFEPYARGPGHDLYPAAYPGPAAMQHDMRTNTAAAAGILLAAEPAADLRLASVGDAYERADFSTSLYSSGRDTPGGAGPELISLLLYKAIYGGDAADVGYDEANAAGVNGISERDWLNVTHWADGLPAPEPAAPAAGERRTWLIDACPNGSGAPVYMGWNYKSFSATGGVANLVYTNGYPSEVSLEVIERMNGASENTVSALTGDAAFFARCLRNNAWGNVAPHAGSTYSNACALARLSGLHPNAAYTFTIFGSRSNSGASRETRYTVTGATAGTALLECNNNASEVAVIPKIRPRPDGTLDLEITPGPANNSSALYYHLNALMIESGYSGTLLSIK
jgi:hypothetical protein